MHNKVMLNPKSSALATRQLCVLEWKEKGGVSRDSMLSGQRGGNVTIKSPKEN